MEIIVKVITNAKQSKIIKGDDYYKIYLTSQPEKGKANKELVKMLAKYFSTKKSDIAIIKGEKDRNKLIIINNLCNKRTDNVSKITKVNYKDKNKDYISRVHCWER